MQVEIRPLKIDDAYTSVKWRNDPEVFKYTGNTYDHEITIESELAWIERVISNPKDYRCAIIADNVYVGNIYLTEISNVSSNYHIFIGDKNYWGKGVAKQASNLIIDYARNILCLKTLKLRVKQANLAALRLYDKLGFRMVEEVDERIAMELIL